MVAPEMGSIPFVGGKGTLRDDILSVLADEQLLSAKEIFIRVKRQFGRDITYQAVHKTIKQLVDKKVLTKDKQKYHVAKEWIEQTKDYVKLIENTYSHVPIPEKIIRHLPKSTKIHFSQFTELAVFTAKLLVAYQERHSTSLPNFALLNHIWAPIKFDISMWELFRKMDGQNPKTRVVVAQKTAFDLLVAKYYRISGDYKDKQLIGLPQSEKVDEDIMVKGDLVIQVHYSEKTKKELHEIFSGIRSLTDLFHLYFIHGKQEGPFDIEVTISENPAMAKLIREKVKSYFGEK